MILIIAEKPSLGRNIAEGIKYKHGITMQQRQGFMTGGDYIITWAFGHLYSLVDIESYTHPNLTEKRRWNMDNIPCFPSEFKYEVKRTRDGVDTGVARQVKLIENLLARDDIDTVVNAGDADREGEIIIRTCVTKLLKRSVSFKRLWLPDQTPETVSAALDSMKEEREYDHLASEGYARTYIDWLYGVNLTRYASLKTGTLLRVGRVIVPIVKAIYDRDMAIANFVPEKYYAIVSKAETDGEEIEFTSKHKFLKDQLPKAQELCQLYNQTGAVVTKVKKKKDKLSPGKLYSLSKLQNVLGKKFKMSMGESLEIIQKLYEEGYLTYPRTNSEYLATAEKDKISKILDGVARLGYNVKFKEDKNIFDDSKIESHSALTPTYKIPKKDKLTEKEWQVYSTVFRRFAAVFCAEDCIVEKTEITVNVGELEEFTLKGLVMVEKGWTKYDDNNKNDKTLPKLKKGDKVNIDFKPTEKQTTPPKHYTIETLNNYLKNPFREEKASKGENEDDREEYLAMFEGLELGTEATRTGIIDNARKSEYIQLKKDVYTILPGGIYLIESLKQMDISMDKFKTAELGKALKKVYRGEITIDDSVELAKKEISEAFAQKTLPIELDTNTGFFGDVVGKCPICGHEVKKMTRSYSCMGYKENGCNFSVFFTICGRVISSSNMKLLLETGRTSKIKNFVSKRTGKTFDAYLKLENGKAVFDFNDQPLPPLPLYSDIPNN